MNLSFSNPGSVKYEDIFKPGDKVRCLNYTKFTDGTEHFVGQIITVKEDTKHYYNVMSKYYEKVS
jgi:hypothetical protein